MKTFARRREKSVQQLLSRVRENEGAPTNQPVVAVCVKQAVILRPPAFQAGCRGFEPRLPLLPLQLSIPEGLLRLIPRHILGVHVSIMRIKLEHLIYNLGQVGTIMIYSQGNRS